MDRIKVLQPEVYNLIAAGEVLEKPYGAVKELVENSIDAGANRIAIEVANGGFDLISVSDNGSGIAEDDIELAFVKHATSKLQFADDLFAVQTLGFRGEALSSIAAVARVRLTSRTRSADTAVSVRVEDGVVCDKQYAAANVGTKIEVRDLFYNTPVRKKFFKSPTYESIEITKFVAKLILTNPNLEISYTVDGKVVYATKGTGLEEAIFSVYGSDCLSNCLKVSYSRELLRIDGYIGSPEYTKANRNYQTLSVNGRSITDNTVSAAIKQAFTPYIMTRKFPFYVLNLEIPCDQVDVNVHPKKTEVRFAEQNKIYSAFYHCVADALQEYTEQTSGKTFAISDYNDEIPTPVYTQEGFLAKFNKFSDEENIELMNKGQLQDLEAIEQSTIEEDRKHAIEQLAEQIQREVSVEKARKKYGFDDNDYVKQSTLVLKNVEQTSPLIVPELSEEDKLFERARILGVAFKTYLIVEIDDKVIFVDQHAAHERMLFDKFMEREHQNLQTLMFPYVFTVNESEALFIEENLSNILSAGIEIEPFGHNTYRITAVSTLLADTKMDEFVQFLLSSIEDFKLDDRTLIVEAIAKKACKAAVKAGYTLNEYEIKYILKEVCNNKIVQCPHGRPVTTVMTKTQLEKMFKRIV